MSQEKTDYYFTTEIISGGSKFVAWDYKENARVPFMMVLDLLARGDLAFLTAFLKVLRSETYRGYFFETPPVAFVTVITIFLAYLSIVY